MINTILSGFQGSYISEIVSQNDFLRLVGVVYVGDKFSLEHEFNFSLNREDLRNGKSFDLNQTVYDKNIVDKASQYIFNALTLFDRFDVNQNVTTFERLEIVYKNITFWISKIEDNSIDLIISREIPHFPHEYCLYIAAKITNTKILMFDNVEHFKRMLCLTSIEDRTVNNISEYSKCSLQMSEELLLKLRRSHNEVLRNSGAPKVTGLMAKWSPIKWLHYILFDIFSLAKHGIFVESQVSILLTRKQYIRKKSPPHILVRSYFFITRIKAFYLDIFYARLSRKFKLSTLNNKKTIVFFANYQPERTTNPDGGCFVNIYNAVNLICKGLPDDWCLVYKEHPHSFSPPFRHLFRGALFRDFHFYNKLKKLGVIFAPVKQDSFKLLSKSNVACSINGTILL